MKARSHHVRRCQSAAGAGLFLGANPAFHAVSQNYSQNGSVLGVVVGGTGRKDVGTLVLRKKVLYYSKHFSY